MAFACFHSQHFLECGDVEHVLRKHLLQLGVLGIQGFQPLGLGHFHTAILRAPFNGMDVSPAIGNAAGVTQQNGERHDSRIHWN